MNIKSAAFLMLLTLSGCATLQVTSKLTFFLKPGLAENFYLDFKNKILIRTKSFNGVCDDFSDRAIQCDYIANSAISIWVNPNEGPNLVVFVSSSNSGFWPPQKTKMASGEYVPKDHLDAEMFVVQNLRDLNLVGAKRTFSGFGITADVLARICPECNN